MRVHVNVNANVDLDDAEAVDATLHVIFNVTITFKFLFFCEYDWSH